MKTMTTKRWTRQDKEREEIERIMDAAAIAAETMEALMPNRSYKSPCSSRLGLISACETALNALEEIGIYGSRLTIKGIRRTP